MDLDLFEDDGVYSEILYFSLHVQSCVIECTVSSISFLLFFLSLSFITTTPRPTCCSLLGNKILQEIKADQNCNFETSKKHTVLYQTINNTPNTNIMANETRSPRFVQWLAFLVFSIITLGSVVEVVSLYVQCQHSTSMSV
jgi:hypothetical protein